MKAYVGIALCLAVALGTEVTGQPDSVGSQSLTIGGGQVRIGMTRAEVDEAVSKGYVVSKEGIIRSRSGPPYHVAGSVSFDGRDRVVDASRSWGPNDQQAGVPLFESIYSAVAQAVSVTPDGRRVCDCLVELTEAASPEATRRIITFWPKGGAERHIAVDNLRFSAGSRFDFPETATVEEVLRQRASK